MKHCIAYYYYILLKSIEKKWINYAVTVVSDANRQQQKRKKHIDSCIVDKMK